jgi:hypothetical protein
MAKLLKDVLKGKNTSTKVTNDLGGYKPKAGDEEDFAKKHEIEKKDHTNSPEHQFNGNPQHYVLNSKKEKRHGYMAGTDEKVYESKKAEDVQCNRTPKGTECPMHGLNECMSGGTIREKSLKEVLTKKDPASKWIHDFVHSKNPKFDGKSTKDRQQQALAAYYAKQRNEEVEAIDEKVKTTHENPLVTVHDKDGLHTHANLSTANKIFNTKVKHTDVHAGPVKTKDGHETKNNLTFAISKHHASAIKENFDIEEAVKTDNEGHGYHGTVKAGSHEERGKKYAEMHAHVKKLVGGAGHLKDARQPNNMVKHFLDSTHGRHIADEPTDSNITSRFKHFKKSYKPVHYKEDLAVPLLQGDSSSDESAEMAKAELKAIANQAMNLVMQIPDSMTVEPWVQSKIAQAKVMISSVHDYMVYGDHDKENEQTDTPMDITTASNPTNTFPNKSVDVGYNV